MNTMPASGGMWLFLIELVVLFGAVLGLCIVEYLRTGRDHDK